MKRKFSRFGLLLGLAALTITMAKSQADTTQKIAAGRKNSTIQPWI